MTISDKPTLSLAAQHMDACNAYDDLSQPEPVKPSFNEIMQIAQDFFVFRGNSHGDSFFATDIIAREDPGQSLEKFARALLSRWGGAE